MEKYLFIINPKSGTRSKDVLVDQIHELFHDTEYQIKYTEYPQHASELCKQGIKENITNIIAIGGDGTVNEIASALIHTNVTLGIVPFGSGNGFARHLQIPMNPFHALTKIKSGTKSKVDIIQINGKFSCNTSGLGFDGYVAKIFGKDGKRGFVNYLRLGLFGFSNYPAFTATINNIKYQNLLVCEVANSSQMGNNAYVSPHSSITDGVAEIVLFQKPSWGNVPFLLYSIFTKKLNRSKHCTILSLPNADISFDRPLEFHIDGEYISLENKIKYEIIPLSLQILT